MLVEFNNKFASIEFDNVTSVLYQIWKPATSEMSDNDYRTVQENTVNAVKKHKAPVIFADTLNFRYAITIEMQTWSKDFVLDPLMNLGVRKIAYLVSSEMLSQMSIEQAVGESKSFSSKSKYFSDKNEALKWLSA